MKNKILCFVFGHDWKCITKRYEEADMENHITTVYSGGYFVVTEYNQCQRCSKKEKRVLQW